MGEQDDKRAKKQICVGLLAHVDAGKTTLAENILYTAGVIRKMGRVDHRDTFFDTQEMERERGITIFSKQAVFSLGEMQITLLDTPGHADFSAEMERTLQVLDYAVLLVSGPDGVQSHLETLWRLLSRYRIPVFLFINKMDQPGTNQDALLSLLQSRLDSRCVAFSVPGRSLPQEEALSLREPEYPETFWENIAVCDDGLLERYLAGEQIGTEDVANLIRQRKLFPCYFGSALKDFGVKELLQGLFFYLRQPKRSESFGARVFKISRDSRGCRLTHLKVTGGCLKARTVLRGRTDTDENEAVWEEKADQIRLYSGEGYRTIPEAEAGTVCAVTGLSHTFAGQGLGEETTPVLPLLEPVMSYRIEPEEEEKASDLFTLYQRLKQLEEEQPELSLLWEEETGQICARIMGEVQIEALRELIRERFGVKTRFSQGRILYRETIDGCVEGVGHFEPLRHYAEVHLLLEGAAPGSGLSFSSALSEDELDRNWQRLILSHLERTKHRGVLTGGQLTDLKITLVAGRAHPKHTEGGDFAQATERALRQGLMKAHNILLEPVYAFRLTVPEKNVGRAMSDLQKQNARFALPQAEGEFRVLTGRVPAAEAAGYQREVSAYTGGRGQFLCTFAGYEPCHNAGQVIEDMGYDPNADLKNPVSSVFCTHGAGFVVSWDQVEQYMHLESRLLPKQDDADGPARPPYGAQKENAGGFAATQEELEEIFYRTYRPAGQDRPGYKKKRFDEVSLKNRGQTQRPVQETYLLVDGYNIIFSQDALKELAAADLGSARQRLMDALSNYQGFWGGTLILVFDAYRVEGHAESVNRYHNIYVVFTREAETADQYIERTVHRIGKNASVTVATSDALEQVIIYAQGARRMSAGELWEELERTRQQIRETWEKQRESKKNYLFDQLSEEMAGRMEEIRLGKREFDSKS